MRIGLLTYHWVANYGANLQALSTYCYLDNNGYNPIIINWVPNDALADYQNSSSEEQLNAHHKFIKTRCRLTRQFSEQSEISAILNEEGITHVLVGSDALFNIIRPHFHLKTLSYSRPSSDHLFPNLYWGKGFETIPHAGISISSQNCRYFEFLFRRNEIGGLLKQYSKITVRDNWTQSLVSYFTRGKIKPEIAPDPVFAYNTNVPQQPNKEEICRRFNLSEQYIIVCFDKERGLISPEGWVERLNKEYYKMGIKVVNMLKPVGGQQFKGIEDIQMPIDPMDWYCLIKYSHAYIGVLMHPIIVALHNAIPFFSFDQYGIRMGLYKNYKSSKTYHILREANLLDYHWSMVKGDKFPEPKDVVDCLNRFPKQQCYSFAIKMNIRCINNMESLAQSLINI